MRRWIIAAVLTCVASAAIAQAFNPFRFAFGTGGAATCAGAVDLSLGCVEPMLGVL